MPRISMLEAYNGAALSQEDAQAFEELASGVISDLQRAVVLMETQIYAAQLSGLVSSDTAQGLMSARGTWNALIERYQNSIADVISGDLEPMRWLSGAEVVLNGVDGQGGIADTARLLRTENNYAFLGERFQAVKDKLEKWGKNLEDGLNTAIDWSKWLLPGLMVGGGLIFLLAINRTASSISLKEGRGLKGYRRRKRKK